MNIVFSSCGNDSVALIQWAIENELDNLVVAYSDTQWAAPFWQERIEKVRDWVFNNGGVMMVIQSEGFPNLVRRKQAFPTNGMGFCSYELKIKPAMEWLEAFDPEKKAVCYTGVMRIESEKRKNWPEVLEESPNHGNRKLVSPLACMSLIERNELLERAGFDVLPHRSMECSPCINATIRDIQEVSESDLIKVVNLENEMGIGKRSGKPKFMFRSKKTHGAQGFAQVKEWADHGGGKYSPDQDDLFVVILVFAVSSYPWFLVPRFLFWLIFCGFLISFFEVQYMIHYHGTPVGGTRQDVARFLRGRHALVSFYRPDDIAPVLECCQSFILDNGAFSHWKAGKGEIDFDEYQKWVETYSRHPSFDWCLIPDKIDGDESENMKLVQKWLGRNIAAESVPVWHLHESLEYLNWLCNKFKWVAFGSSGQFATPGVSSWWHRMAEAMNIVCDDGGRPKVKLHGLRMLDPDIFTKLPFSSADSTNAAVNCGSLSRFGIYKPPTAAQRAEVIAERIEAHNSAHLWQQQIQLGFAV